MSDQDQEIYKDFNLVVSERWQAEIAGNVDIIFYPNILEKACVF